MFIKSKPSIFLIVTILAFSTLSAQDLFVGNGSNVYLDAGTVITVSGNITSEENITGSSNGRISLIGNSNTTLDLNNKTIHGLDIQKSSSKSVTLLDSFSVNNLYLSSGSLLLGSFTTRVNENMDNNATNIINTEGTGSLKFDYLGSNTDTLFLDQTSIGISNQLIDLYIKGKAKIHLGNYVNIKRLAYLGKSSGLISNTINPYIKMVATDATTYGQLQFEQGAILTGRGTSEMINTHEATYIHLGTPYLGSTFAELSDDVTIFFNASGGKPNQWNLHYFNESITSKTGGVGQSSFWNAVNAESDVMPRGNGYALYTWADGMPGVSLPVSYPNTIDVSGVFDTTRLNYIATRTTLYYPFNADSTGYHILANPYYCNVKVPTLPVSFQGQSFYRYVSGGNGTYQYVGYNTNTNTSINGGTQYVAPMQALYFQMAQTQPFHLDASWQQSNPSNNFNQWKNAMVTDQIRLTAQSNSNKNTDEAIIGFMGTAENGFAIEDSRKVNNGNTYPNIFTYADDNRLAFNYLNTVNEETTIPVGFSAATNGSYNIIATNEEQDQVNTMILEDKKEKTFTNLSFGGNYSFEHDSKNATDRFVLHLKKTTSGVSDIQKNTFNVYAADNNISIKFNNTNNENISVNIFDMLGREMINGFEGKNITENLNFSTSGWASAYYLVNIKTGTETKTTKVLVK